MEKLTNIDNLLVSQVSDLQNVAFEMNFSHICDFDLTEKGLAMIPWENLKHSGIYYIQIWNCNSYSDFGTWVQNFQTQWMDAKYRHKFVANPKKSRIAQHSSLPAWIPLYIGKSKNISKRVNEHIYLGLDKPTFALKLANRDHLLNDKFRLSCIRVEVKNYDWIMPILEKTLRDRFNPIIGRQ